MSQLESVQTDSDLAGKSQALLQSLLEAGVEIGLRWSCLILRAIERPSWAWGVLDLQLSETVAKTFQRRRSGRSQDFAIGTL